MAKYDVGTGLMGAATGFASGGILGAGAGLVSGFFGKKKKKKPKKISTLDEDQQKLNKAQHGAVFGEGPLADLYNYDADKANEVFDKNIGRLAYRNLKEKTIPAVTGEFRSNGLMQSSYAGDAVAKLARDVQESLDAQRSQYQFGLEQDAKNAKRQSVENLQNRQTFAYDQGQQKQKSSGFGDILNPSNWEDIGNTVFNMLPGGV